MPVELVYPTATEIKEIDRELIAVLEEDDPVFFKEIMPVENSDTDLLEWEQRDNLLGLQQARGLNGEPTPVEWVGGKRFRTDPGYYGEFKSIDEELMTRLRPYGQLTGQVDVSDLVGEAQLHLANREYDRIRWLGWKLLTTGTFLVARRGGGYEHRDTYQLETLTMSPGLSTVATAAPFAFLGQVQLEGRGTSTSFDRGSTVYVNQVTANRLLANINPNDLGGRYRVGGGNTLVSIDDMNRIMTENNRPTFTVYDKGYLSDGTDGFSKGEFVPFIPDGYGVAVGKRANGARVGYYRKTRNANNDDFAPGTYALVVDSLATGNPVPRRMAVHRGHNGGPVLEFPSAVKILNLG